MKTSVLIIVIAASVIVGIMIGIVIIGRVAGVPAMLKKDRSGITKHYSLKDFTAVEIDNAWDINISQSENYFIEVNSPGNMEPFIVVEVRGETLYFDMAENHAISDDIEAEIKMPSLRQLRVDGLGRITVSGFHEDVFEVGVDGAAKIEVEDSSAQRVEVSLDGLGRIDLSDMPTVDAHIELDGAGKIELNMAGGVLSGYLDGMGTVRYSGTISDSQFEIDGMGKLIAE